MDLDKFLKNLQKEEEAAPEQGNDNNNSPYLRSYYINKDMTLKFRIYPNLKDSNDNPFEQNFVHMKFENPEVTDDQGNPKMWVYTCLGRDCPLCGYARTFPDKSDDFFRYKARVNFDYYIQLPNGQAFKLVLSYAAHQALKTTIINAAKTGINSIDLDSGRWFELTRRQGDNRVHWDAAMSDEESPMTAEQKARLKVIKPLSELNPEPKKEDLQKAVDFKKGTYKRADEQVKEDSIAGAETLDLELPEDDIDSPEETFDFGSVDIEIDDDIKFEDDE